MTDTAARLKEGVQKELAHNPIKTKGFVTSCFQLNEFHMAVLEEQLIAEKGVILTVDEVNGFLNQLDEEDEFDDIEWVPIASLSLLVVPEITKAMLPRGRA